MRKYDLALQEIRKPNPNVEGVIGLLQSAAESKDHRAIYALATWYLHGQYVVKDLPKAAHLLKDAAALGNRDAMFDLAVCFEQGAGVEKDLSEAFNYYITAAAKGENQSYYEIGRMLYYGLGTTENMGLADIWLDRAEKRGISRKEGAPRKGPSNRGSGDAVQN